MGVPRATAPRGPVLSGREWTIVAALYLAIGVATAAGFILLVLVARTYDTAAIAAHTPFVFSALGIAAYVLGLRHGVDADHIAAIDNTTRKLLQEGKRPLTVGTWFSLGHSTVVVGLIVVAVLALDALSSRIGFVRSVGNVLGSLVAGAFLCVLGIINLIIVFEVYRIFRGLKRGELDASALEEQLNKRGLMNRAFGRFFRLVATPRQIYPIGVLFGLGFDTASEIALIAIAVLVAGAGQIPVYVVLVLPLLFTCGMVLVDTTDAVTMRVAYGWAFERPIRKIYYNLTVTIISVLVAFAIGGVELLSVVALELGLSGGIWTVVTHVDLGVLGYAIIAIFVVVWAISVGYYRYRRYDELPFPRGGSREGSAG
jgi:nickel/cobalt transporter (NiCoT) family protein